MERYENLQYVVIGLPRNEAGKMNKAQAREEVEKEIGKGFSILRQESPSMNDFTNLFEHHFLVGKKAK